VIDEELFADWETVEESRPEDKAAWDLYNQYYEAYKIGDPNLKDLQCDDLDLPENLAWFTQEDCELA
jgi:hypothetical protein